MKLCIMRTRRDCLRNNTIRATLGVKAVIEVLGDRGFKRLGHVYGMGDDRKARWLMEARSIVMRPVGRPRLLVGYNEYIDKLGDRGSPMDQLQRMALNRDIYKRWTKATPPFTTLKRLSLYILFKSVLF